MKASSRWRCWAGSSVVLSLVAFHNPARAEDRTPVVSLVALIGQPQAFAGKRIVITGFCSLEFEDTSVYLHEEDYRRTLVPNSIWLDVEPTRSSNPDPAHEKYCIVEGTFSARPARNGRLGRLEHVTRMEVLPSRAELAAKLKP